MYNNNMEINRRLIPIYTTRGDLGGLLIYPYIFNRQGEWIGWVTNERKVYSVHGHFVGNLTNDPRIIRRVSDGFDQPQREAPPPPRPVNCPPSVPLAPMMPELTQGMIDVLEEAPELMPSLDAGELREDMD
jgi:hypothetical protein